MIQYWGKNLTDKLTELSKISKNNDVSLEHERDNVYMGFLFLVQATSNSATIKTVILSALNYN